MDNKSSDTDSNGSGCFQEDINLFLCKMNIKVKQSIIIGNVHETCLQKIWPTSKIYVSTRPYLKTMDCLELQSLSCFILYQSHIIFINMNLCSIIAILLLVAVLEGKLHQVASLFRHGARYHINGYYDGNSTKQLWGELSAVGMRQHQTLGHMLRQDYIERQGFLQTDYVFNSIKIISTDVNRTIESARSQLYGLYPLGSGPKIPQVPKELLIPPYSMDSDCEEQEYTLPRGYLPFAVNINDSIVMTDCANWDKLIKRNIDNQKLIYDEMTLTYAPFLRRMGQTFGIDSAAMNFSKISSLYDTLTVDKYLGRPMPANFTDSDYLNMRHLHYWLNYFKISFNLSKAINTGKLTRILQDFDARISNSSQVLKWTFLSAHDTDISGMLLDLNVSSAQCVEELYRNGRTDALNCDPAQEYASSIIFELHSDNGKDFYVKIRHDGNYVFLCEQKSTSCPYEEWKQRVKQNIIIGNVQQLCFGKDGIDTPSRYESSA